MSNLENCIFCNIVAQQPESVVYADQQVVALEDLNPQAPIHLLIFPRQHIATIDDMERTDMGLIGDSVKVAQMLARQYGINETGYRLVYNVNRGAGQSVFHIHLHLLGGRSLTWPPG